ncbi:phage Gp37/Gp68 family protein [Phragmitibacter flavus]|uniref:Phage Gp37/Gp68 family protein n=1 Tax=Phragmitibacter flavus TaxID=2576071 RepID=A0A5R8KGB3_9BACT|nr:phage Gp37/Gp68 family protein [Phragmitibacter flavus]TLD71334.1 phage Gp37/Gp68 family protein [Phragmitibacter flavus]
MAKNSSIEWTHHTFNPWWGCSKVSPACEHCYAETWAKRVGKAVWGAKAPRRFFSDNHWKEPLKWNAEAKREGVRRRVFCASMADVFERRSALNEWRDRLWSLVDETPMLDWLLLTKRPQNVSRMTPWGECWPDNVWLGTTVESQKYAELRLPFLLSHPAKVRFLSCEPLLGDIDLRKWINPNPRQGLHGIDWIIAGGESGPGARPMHPLWARNLRDQALETNTAFHFKQWGHWVPREIVTDEQRQQIVELEGEQMIGLGKKGAGRELDGDTWDGFPLAS